MMRQTTLEKDACGIGAVVNIDGRRDNRTIDDALRIVEKLEHRAGKDATGKVGDGVGILTQIPDAFLRKAAKESGISLPGEAGDFGCGMFFLPKDPVRRSFAMRMFQVIVEKNGMTFLGWRPVPIHPELLGGPARESCPEIYQCFIARPEDAERGLPFDRKLYAARREYEQSRDDTYICSLSSRTIVYKGMFLVTQLRAFYDDLRDDSFLSAIALVHSRFSTNTTPSWNRAHPYRMIAHNGEINTIRGNADRMLAREETMDSPLIQTEGGKVFPVIAESGSDSAMLDNTIEFFTMNGLDPALCMMMLIPEPWRGDGSITEKKKDFYHYYSTMMEPWDGPAAILFTDGDVVIATLDRNGLRPSRYYVTSDKRLILSSEVGVLDIPPEKILKKDRLHPGKLLLVDTKKGEIIPDETCKRDIAERQPYGEWLDQNLLRLQDLPIPNKKVPESTQRERDRLYRVFGYTYEDVKDTILPMAENGIEQTASMGHDVPLAVLSENHELLFSYFKQMFAQVTNPPIDSIRERIVTDTAVYLGSDGNLLSETGENCHVLEVENPVLTGVDLMKIKALSQNGYPGFRSRVLSILYYKYTSLEKALDQLFNAADRAYAAGCSILILSDRGVDENHVPIPSLLAVSALEQHLVRTKKRTSVSIVLESAEPRDVHQIATLFSFGARAVNPYLAHECIGELITLGLLDKDYHTAVRDYNHALLDGVVKTAAKMGISTIQSYQSAKIFEAVGLSEKLISRYFTGIASRVSGIGLREIAEDVTFRHDQAFDPFGLPTDMTLDSTGFHALRSGKGAEDHLYDPVTIITLQRAVREGNQALFREYTERVNNELPHTLRACLSFRCPKEPVPLEEVEPASEIVKRFKTGAMSFGSLSREAHETMALAMNRLGGKSNTGEGGEDPARYGTDKNSAIKQVASGRFGVTSGYLCSAKEIQIKMAQGAKPGEGGHLPGRKVDPTVARIRCSTPGVSLISPPPHHDIYSIEDLAQLIYDLKNANRDARINVKLVSENGVGTIASGVAKAGATVILISGYDGGTGAAPQTSIHNAGLPWELGIAEAHRALIENGMRERVALEADGKLMSGRDVAIAALLGAEEFGFATTALVSMGCMMMRVCSKDTCPVGIATQNETLRNRFHGRPEDVCNFMTFIAEELREIMASLGFRTVEEMVGRTDRLALKEKQYTDRANLLDLHRLIDPALASAPGRHFRASAAYDFHLERTLDESVLLPEFSKALKTGEKHCVSVQVSSTDRTFGTILGSEVTRRFGNALEEDTFTVKAEGGGGQSFGAFLPKGITLILRGDANDGFGKGLSGGKLILLPPRDLPSSFRPEENIIVGNVALYGATGGNAYIAGVAGERFLVRNSGATAVAEGCGDHGLEYMTGGLALILGRTGRNFAAGMSGGTAFVLDEDHTLYQRLNKEMVTMKTVSEKEDIQLLKSLLETYARETDSSHAKRILESFDTRVSQFKKILPKDYEKMLSLTARLRERGLGQEDAEKEAFERIRKEG